MKIYKTFFTKYFCLKIFQHFSEDIQTFFYYCLICLIIVFIVFVCLIIIPSTPIFSLFKDSHFVLLSHMINNKRHHVSTDHKSRLVQIRSDQTKLVQIRPDQTKLVQISPDQTFRPVLTRFCFGLAFSPSCFVATFYVSL